MTRRKRDEDRNGYADVFFVRLMGDEDVIDYDDYNEDDDEDNEDNDDGDKDGREGCKPNALDKLESTLKNP